MFVLKKDRLAIYNFLFQSESLACGYVLKLSVIPMEMANAAPRERCSACILHEHSLLMLHVGAYLPISDAIHRLVMLYWGRAAKSSCTSNNLFFNRRGRDGCEEGRKEG